jgi:hypothetical protein
MRCIRPLGGPRCARVCTSDPDARLYKKSYGKESHLAYLGHALVKNRNGLIAAAMATQADGYAEREAALLLLEEKQKRHCRDFIYHCCLRTSRRDRPLAERAERRRPISPSMKSLTAE